MATTTICIIHYIAQCIVTKCEVETIKSDGHLTMDSFAGSTRQGLTSMLLRWKY